jgi:hypothetical protein
MLRPDLKEDWVEMDFPAKPEESAAEPEGLAQALGVQIKYLGKNQFDYLVEVDSEEIVRSLKPDFTRLGILPVRGVMVTSLSSSPGYDFVSRFFAPRVGVIRPVTVRSRRLGLSGESPNKRNSLPIRHLQADSASPKGPRVVIGGQAVTVLAGTSFKMKTKITNSKNGPKPLDPSGGRQAQGKLERFNHHRHRNYTVTPVRGV